MFRGGCAILARVNTMSTHLHRLNRRFGLSDLQC